MPWKAPKAKNISLQDILAAIDAALDLELSHIEKADLIRIENQPSEFAPHMKSIQMILFTLLSHRLIRCNNWKGKIEFANAATKTKGTSAGTGKDAKRSRKLAGIQKVTDILSDAELNSNLVWWQSQLKKDDLADAFLMCLDGARSS